MSARWKVLVLHALSVAGIALGFAGNAVAAPAKINGTQTTLQGNSEVIISLRHQDHMWEAANGETYVVINRGASAAQGSLQVYSSPDRGLSWFPGPRLPGSTRNSFSDGYLDGNILYLTYTNVAGEVVFTALQRRVGPAIATWKTVWSETAFSSPAVSADNPAMAVDAAGTIWLAFVAEDLATGNYSIRMLRNTSREEGWVDTGLTYGDVDNLSIERSAKPVATATGMGMVYAVHNQIFWASRENDWPLDQPWTGQVVFTSSSSDNDPYASHFSIAADAERNIHMSLTDGNRVGYSRYDAAARTWSSKWLTGVVNAAYIQTSIVAGDVVVTANSGSSRLMVYRSADNGNSFTFPYTLEHPAPGNGVSYLYARMETAATTTGPMLVLQQYIDNNTQRLLRFSVPLP